MRIFKETQRFTQPWLIIILLISLIVPLTVIGKQWFYKTDKNFESMIELISIIIILIISVSVIFFFNLKTRIDSIGIHYKFFPIHSKFKVIKWNEIEKAYVRKYNPITEYGGWGIKSNLFFKKNGKSYNVSGNIGIQIKLKTGKNILIGTTQKNNAEYALKYNFSKNE